jgi:hypothetical protein
MFRVQVAGQQQLGDLARDLRRAGKGLRPKLTAELKEQTKPIYDAVREDILHANMRARGRNPRRRFPDDVGQRGHVKRPTAAGLSWKVSTAVGNPRAEVVFQPSKVPGRIRALVPYWLGQRKRLRHPLMGNRKVWISQSLPDVWKQTKELLPAAQKAAQAAIDETSDIIAGRR